MRLRSSHQLPNRLSRSAGWLCLLLVVVGGLWLAWWRGHAVDLEFRQGWMQQANSLAHAIGPERAKALPFGRDNENDPRFQQMQRQLVAFSRTLGIGRIFTVALQQGNLVFGPDSQERVSNGAVRTASFPADLTQALRQTFTEGEPQIHLSKTSPAHSRICALAPVKDDRTGEAVIVVGIEGDHAACLARIHQLQIFTALGALLFAAVAGWGWYQLRRRDRSLALAPPWMRHAETWMTAAIGVVLSIVVAGLLREQESAERRHAFGQIAEAQAALLQARKQDLRELILRGLAEALEDRNHLTAAEFRHRAQLLVQHLRIQGVGWVPRVTAAERPFFEMEARRSGVTNFAIFERDQRGNKVLAARREAYFPVLFSEPRQGNEDWIGFDLGSEPHRRQALWQALRTGLSAATDPWESHDGKRDQSEFLAFYPVFHGGALVGKEAARSVKEPAGFIVAVLRCGALLEQAMATTAVEPGLTRVEEFQIDPELGPQWLAAWPRSAGRKSNPQFATLTASNGEPALVRPIFAFGKTYVVSVLPGPAFLAGTPHEHSWMVGLTGLLLSLAVTTLVAVTRGRQVYLRQQLRVRTEALRASASSYRRQFADSRAIMLLIDPTDARILDANHTAVRYYGYSRSQLLTQRLTEMSPAAEVEVCQAIASLQANGGNCFDLRQRRADGSIRDVMVTGSLVQHLERQAIHLIIQDVTDHRRAESAVQESETLQRMLLENMAAGVVIVDVETRQIERVNQAAARLLGATKGQIVGRRCEDFLDAFQVGKDTPPPAEAAVDIVAGVVRRVDGQSVPILQSIKRIALDGREKLLQSFVDISRQKAAEAALEAREARLDSILRTTPVGIGLVFDRVLAEVNGFLCQMVGRSEAELLGQSTRLLYPSQEEFERVGKEGYASLEGNASFTLETRWQHRDGSIRNILLRGSAVVPNAPDKGITFVALDITERLQVEEALRINAERLQMYWQAIEQSPASILITDVQGCIEYVNPKLLEVTGYSMEEIIGQTPRLLKSGQMSPEFYQEMWRTLNAGQNWNGEICNRRKDGAVFWESALISPIRNQQGVITRYLAIKENITARKLAESELQETNEQLEQASARANQMALQAELASITKSQFLANMSHEIRTPMNGIIGMTELLLETKLTPEQKEFASIARNSSHALLGLLNDILDFSKIEAGKMQLEKLDFNLRTTLEDAVEMLAVKAAEKGLEIVCLIAPEVPLALKGDPARLRQILVNLGSNAIKFTRQGEVILRAEMTARDAGKVTIRFTVSDTGIGIPAARLDALFKPFTQVDGSTTRKYGGTGLGLAISKQLSELMGGQIGVESQEGAGSTFWFTVVLDETAATQPQEVPLDSTLTGLRVLLIEDHPACRQAASTYLRGWGCAVVEAQDAQTGLALLAEAARQGQPFPVALIDRSLPDLDGVELGRKIAADPALYSTRLIMAAALDKRNDRAQLQQMGFAAVLTKPIRHQSLHSCLHTVLTAPRQAPPATVPGSTSDTVFIAPPDRHRLLLVDDNVTNQTVAGKILNKLGYDVDLAGGGQEALQAMATTRYSLVLMDCQMPEMDGFEVTRRVRRGEAGVLDPKVPIIAMTARTLQGDRELCLQAGMDDYLTKPIDRRALADTLDRWLVHRTPASSPPTPAALAPNPSSAIEGEISLETFPTFEGKGFLERLMNDLDLADMVAATYIGDIPNQFQALKQAIDGGEAAAAGALAHRIKGATANVGGVALQKLAHKMETAGKANDLAALKAMLPEATAQLQRLLEVLAKKEWRVSVTPSTST